MPLEYKKTKGAYERNIEKLRQEGRKENQAVAIALKIKRGYKPKKRYAQRKKNKNTYRK